MIPALINLIFYLLILGILVALVFWVLTQLPIPEPINRIIRVAIVVVVVLVVILVLLNVMGGGSDFNLPKIAS
jgi:hypothetical protein